MRAIDAVRKSIVTVAPEMALPAVAQRMDDAAVGAVVVVGTMGEPIGVVTDRDLVVRGLARGNVDGRADSVMSTSVVTVDADVDLHDVLRVFDAHAVRRVVLVRTGLAVGVLSVDDLLVDLLGDVTAVLKPVAAEVLFGHREVGVPAAVAA
jgi:predicted transcriptional regulator